MSSIALASGMLRLMAAESAPSAITQRADGSTPASSSSVESFTPVHSAQLKTPWMAAMPSGCGCGALSAWLLPAHSMKAMRDCIG